MNSPTIAAMVSGLKPHAERRAVSGEPEAAQDNTFADVLAGQSPSQTDSTPSEVVAADPSGKGARPVEGDGGPAKTTPDTAGKKDEQDGVKETAAALPQIALEIALHARDQARARGINTESIRSVNGHASEPGALERSAKQPVAENTTELSLESRTQSMHAERDHRSLADSNLKVVLARATGSDQPGALNPAQAASQPALRQSNSNITPATAALSKRLQAATGGMSGNRDIRVAPQRGASDPGFATAQFKAQEQATFSGADANLVATADVQAGAPLSPISLSTLPTSMPSPTATSVPTIVTPVQQPGWSTDFSQQVVRVALDSQNGTQTVEMRLDPPELGPLRISLSLNDGMASALFASAHASVRQAVESALPQLSQQLAQAGISLGETHVGDQGQAGFNSEDEMGRSGAGQRHARGDDATVADIAISPRRAAASDALVDTFA